MPEKKPTVFDLTGAYETADQIESGRWFESEHGKGLQILVARGGSPEFYKVAARAGKKFGRGRTKEVPPEKNLDSLIWVMARANFKGFRGPEGERAIVEVSGETFEDTEQGREGLLSLWPDFRDEIMIKAGMTADEFQQEISEAGKD